MNKSKQRVELLKQLQQVKLQLAKTRNRFLRAALLGKRLQLTRQIETLPKEVI